MIHRDTIGLEEGWAKMKTGIDKLVRILEDDPTSCFTAEEYMTLYTTTYNMCTQKAPHEYSEELYNRYKRVFETYLQETVLVRVQRQDTGFLLLTELSKAWKNHEIMVRWLTRFFNYLDRYYVVRHNLPTLSSVGLICFRDCVFNHTHVRAKDAVLELIARERENEPIDRDLVKSVLTIFVDVGMEKDKTDVYKQKFEEPLLESIHSHYESKAAHWIQSESCSEYLIKAEASLADEEDRAAYYLHSTSKSPVIDAVQSELLKKPQMQLIEKDTGCNAMLRDNKTDDLRRMFKLYHRCGTNCITPLAEIFRKHIEEEGMGLLNQVKASAEAGDNAAGTASRKESASAEQQFIRNILALQDKYLEVVKDCFQANSSMHKALKDAFESFCNKQVGSSQTPELMANFCDTLLRKGGGERLSDEEMEATLDKVCKLLVYINDRDMFGEFHRKKLARRLLNAGQVEQQEQTFLQRLKQQCGAQFTQRMEGMNSDLATARDKQNDFERWLETQDEKLNTDLDVKVLTTGFWPSYKSADLELPAEMVACVEKFQKFYSETTKHRNLTWIHNLGNMVLKAPFKPQAKELVVVPYQVAVLMLFNEEDILSFDDIRDRLKLTDDDALRTIASLTCSKHSILLVDGGDPKKRPKKLTKTEKFKVNWNFQDKLVRIKVPMPVVEDKKKVVEEVQKDRKYAIDAAIVRTMKSRKALEHTQLVLEVMQQVKRMFAADQKTIKKRIEDLIDREYLERDSQNTKLYKYLA